MKTGIRHYGFILLLLVTLCCYGCTGNGTCDWDGLMEMVQEELNLTGELHYGATCGKARPGNDDAVIWYYTIGNEQKNVYIPVEVKVVGEARYRFVGFLKTVEPVQDIVTAAWQNGCCVFVNNSECVTVEVTKNGRIWTEHNDHAIYPMIYYYDGSVSCRYLDAEGNEVK